jgi:hypothetical protein
LRCHNVVLPPQRVHHRVVLPEIRAQCHLQRDGASV